jgi:hypothetical protein
MPAAPSIVPKPVVLSVTQPLPIPPKEFAGHDWRDAPAAPLDVVAWLDARECIYHEQCPREPFERPLPLRPVIMRTHRLRGPSNLDAEIIAMDPEVRSCFFSHSKYGAASPRVAITLVSRRDAPPTVAIEPQNVAAGLDHCLRDVMSDVRTYAPDIVVIVAGAPL